MVLDEVTLFEVHLDGTEIGSKLGGDTSGEKSEQTETKSQKSSDKSESGGSRRRLALLGVLALATVAVAAWRRRKSSEQTTVDDYTEREGGLADSESVELDDVST